MLLRRVIDHVKAQNWTAVALDFIIVVVGVFIGIQVSNWNAARGERSAERRALELLLAEAENNVAYSELTIYRAGLLQTDREAAMARLQGREPEAGDPISGIAHMDRYRDMTPIHAAYDELSASGDLTLIRSADIRGALALYNGVVIFHDRRRREYMERTPDIFDLASPYMEVEYDPELRLGHNTQIDWTAAGEDRNLVNAINRVMGDQLAFNERRTIILDHARILCDALAEELGKSCAPPDWVGAEIRGEPIQ
ncbi:hypothetical protein [Hyphococcus sp.]|uniref:hypothetical protein n=1 Tax=Hyphococcus sp. TaxID=2038636 RepID=UPI0035C686AD